MGKIKRSITWSNVEDGKTGTLITTGVREASVKLERAIPQCL